MTPNGASVIRVGPAPVLQTTVVIAGTIFDVHHLAWGHQFTWSIIMNTVIYIVGLIVVVGFLLSFFGLR